MFDTAIISPASIKANRMDLWGNAKIPMLRDTGPDSQNVPLSPELEYYSVLVGISMTNISTENETFSFELSWVDLTCFSVPRFDLFLNIGILGGQTGSSGCSRVTSGTESNNTFQNDTRHPWVIALNGFVDQGWYNDTVLQKRHHRFIED
ncbi:hypothetical protein NM208_g12504 [Fusarium decemcellulare]|uniref:Uncharacterized protein n=1 Tax=Fusarium decemcellulare TaxID=57161 RepID=A0ACC1RQF2_9HYPO|nr:hypothetical protein NM208_g12504 [Fusarium decemcellulare]